MTKAQIFSAAHKEARVISAIRNMSYKVAFSNALKAIYANIKKVSAKKVMTAQEIADAVYKADTRVSARVDGHFICGSFRGKQSYKFDTNTNVFVFCGAYQIEEAFAAVLK